MPVKKELCRNFQRGSCKYGEWCKFGHVTQQQPKHNDFGFGVPNASQFQHTSSQQQKPNPFGFGVQNNTHLKGASDLGSKQSQFKPFENKWVSGSNPPPSSQQPANHKCTDPDSCKRQIAEDFEHENPIWKLTCYAHNKSAPCDISGDISFEELQAAAYEDAKSGLNLQTIVDRERSLVKSKLVEFQSLLQSVSVASSNSALSMWNSHPGTSTSTSLPTAKNSFPPSVASFSQLGAALNVGSEMRSSAPPNNTFGQPNAHQNVNQMSNALRTPNMPFGIEDSFGQRLSTEAPTSKIFSHVPGTTENNQFCQPVESQTQLSSSNTFPTGRPNPTSNVGQGVTGINTLNGSGWEKQGVVTDASIWRKPEWSIGEIPEEAPPDEFVW